MEINTGRYEYTGLAAKVARPLFLSIRNISKDYYREGLEPSERKEWIKMTKMDCYKKFVGLVADSIGERNKIQDKTDNNELANHYFWDAIKLFYDELYLDLKDVERNGED